MNKALNLVYFKAGEVILLEGEISDSLYILESGTIEVIKESQVVCELSDRKTFFGEMAFILKRRRTATLRAKTDVKALKIGNLDSDKMDERMAKASISLLKVLASRLDLANDEVRRLEGYADFYQAMKEEAESDPDAKALLLKIESKVNIRHKKDSDQLLSDYLRTPWVWTQIEEAVLEMLKFYLKEELDVTAVEAFDSSQGLLGSCSSIGFSGDRDGTVVVDFDPSIVKAIQQGMGLGDADMAEETTQEMSNLILGNLKKKMLQLSITLSTPTSVADSDALEQVLNKKPALAMNVTCASGTMRLLYQLELTSKVK